MQSGGTTFNPRNEEIMAHIPQEFGWPKRLILTSDVNDYPGALIANADLVVSYDGAVVRHRQGKCEIAATDAVRRTCETLDPMSARRLVDEAARRGQSPAERNRHGAEDVEGELVDPTTDRAEKVRTLAGKEGWQGTTPAEGARRALILEALRQTALSKVPNHDNAIHFADAVESALLQSALDDEAMARGAEALADGIVEGHWDRPSSTVNAQIDHLEERVSRLVGCIGERDNAWVTELAYQVAGAATRPLLEDHGDYEFPSERVQEAVAYLLETYFGIPRACGGCQEEQIEQGRKEAPTADDYIRKAEEEGHMWPKGSPQRRLIEQGRERQSEGDGDRPGSLVELEVEKALNHLMLAREAHFETAPGPTSDLGYGASLRRAIIAVRRVTEPALGPETDDETDSRPPDEFNVRILACERLAERLDDGPVPNAAELARVIDILR